MENNTIAFAKVEPAPTVNETAADMPAESVKMTEEMPPLPFVRQHKQEDSFYVRKCYQDYYKHVKAMLDAGKRCVTVTGTPGIGKSIFYAYFFKHYLEEIKDTYIIAILSVDRTIEEAAVFDHGNKIKDLVVHPSTILADIDAAAVETLEAKKKVFFLCDGAPTRRWRAGQMVVCTSPNVKWLKMVRKDLCTLYMPLWTLEELHEAAFALRNTGIGFHGGDGITDDQIEARFNLFGGVARECFLPTQLLVDATESELLMEMDKISDTGELQNLLNNCRIRVDCHRVLHFVPQKNGISAETQLASPFVVERLALRFLKSVDGDRQKLYMSLEGIPQGASLRGYLFEAIVHERLAEGCDMAARLLQNDASSSDGQMWEGFTIAPSSKPDEFILKELSSKAVTFGPYHKPKSKCFESIDGFYLSKMDSGGEVTEVTEENIVAWNAEHVLLMFQLTISETHAVNASGMTSVLDKLGLLEAVKMDPQRAALVFVIPEDVARDYKRQKINGAVNDNDSVLTVKTIGSAYANELAKDGITKVGELKAAIKDERLQATPTRCGQLSRILNESNYEAMAMIPQYVWPVIGLTHPSLQANEQP